MSKKAKFETNLKPLTEINPDRMYAVKFRKLYVRGRDKFSPIHRYRIKGAILADIPSDRILSAEAIE